MSNQENKIEKSAGAVAKPEPAEKIPDERMERIREQFEGISLNFFFSPHSTPEDIQELRRHIDAADIIVFEALCWNPAALDVHQYVSKADRSDRKTRENLDKIYSMLEGSKEEVYDKQLLLDIEGTNKHIVFADIPRDHELAEKHKEQNQRANELFQTSSSELFNGNYGQSMKLIKEAMEILCQNEIMREDFIIDELAKRIGEIKKEDNKLAEKKETQVLLKMGSGHRRMFHQMRQAGVSATAVMNYNLES